MEGILGKIRGGIEGILGNPFVQGVGGALAFGANPLLGLLAGSGIKDARTRRELNNDVLRQGLTAGKRREDAIGGLTDLLGRNVTQQALTRRAGLLDVEGSSPFEFDIPGRRQSVPEINTAQGQREAQGLLAQISPDNAAANLLGQMSPPPQRANPRAQNLAAFEQSVGRKATESEAQNIFGAGSPDRSIDTLIAEFKLDQLRREEKSDIREKEIEVQEFSGNINSSADALFEMSDIVSRLNDAGGLTQPGIGADIRGSIASLGAFGADIAGFDGLSSELAAGSEDTQRFEDLSSSLALTRLAAEGFDAGTNARFKAFTDTKPQLGSRAGPTNSRIADGFEALLLSDTARPGEGFTSERRAQVEEIIRTLRSTEAVDPDAGLQEVFEGSASDRNSDDIMKALGLANGNP